MNVYKIKVKFPLVASVGGGVRIFDQNNITKAIVAAPGSYEVTTFDGVQDTIDSDLNVVTILDNIL